MSKFIVIMVASFVFFVSHSRISTAQDLRTSDKRWLRQDGGVSYSKTNSDGKFLVYADRSGMGLSITDLKSNKIYQITANKVGPAFFFSPDGYRIFYRELVKKADHPNTIVSRLNIYDVIQNKTTLLEEFPSSTSYLTFDPRDLRLKLLTEKGIITRLINFPGERLAKWQVASRKVSSKWLVTQHGVLWLTHDGYTMKKITDDGSGINSFDISYYGDFIVWATNNGNIYVSREGEDPKKIAEGKDPKWHPKRDIFVFAAANKVGIKVIGYDLKIADLDGKIQNITTTQTTSERWPVFLGQNKLAYTIEGSTDLYKVDVKL